MNLMSENVQMFSEMQTFASHKTDRLTSKMWILPDGVPVSLDQWHYRWILANKTRVAKFGLDTTELPDDEQTVRIAALKKGFFRVNYEINNGALTVEGIDTKYNKKIKDALFMIVMNNLNRIDRINLILVNDTVEAVSKRRSVELFMIHDDGEKMEAASKTLGL